MAGEGRRCPPIEIFGCVTGLCRLWTSAQSDYEYIHSVWRMRWLWNLVLSVERLWSVGLYVHIYIWVTVARDITSVLITCTVTGWLYLHCLFYLYTASYCIPVCYRQQHNVPHGHVAWQLRFPFIHWCF